MTQGLVKAEGTGGREVELFTLSAGNRCRVLARAAAPQCAQWVMQAAVRDGRPSSAQAGFSFLLPPPQPLSLSVSHQVSFVL